MIRYDDTTYMCNVCGELFDMGTNGVVVEDKPTCDSCAGVKRDKDGFAWLPWEEELTLEDPETGEVMTITREKAFQNEGEK